MLKLFRTMCSSPLKGGSRNGAVRCSFYLLFICLLAASAWLSSCSPSYVLRAGWEEATILFGKQPIGKLLQSPSIDENVKEKLRLIQDVRKFARDSGLKPKGSFSDYAQLDRKVLVWVVTASAKTSLTPVTWWFPIVGSFPYKGFFEKADAEESIKKLAEDGYDVYMRPSPAFSTLGWFDDPLLSTMIGYDHVALANVALHEMTHNTVWVRSKAEFNETLANASGCLGAISFFPAGADNQMKAEARWHDELIYARFLKELHEELTALYSAFEAEAAGTEQTERLLRQKEAVFTAAKERWKAQFPSLKTQLYKYVPDKLNNAVVISDLIYLDRLWLFDELYTLAGKSYPAFIEEVEEIADNSRKRDSDPYAELQRRLEELRLRSTVTLSMER